MLFHIRWCIILRYSLLFEVRVKIFSSLTDTHCAKSQYFVQKTIQMKCNIFWHENPLLGWNVFYRLGWVEFSRFFFQKLLFGQKLGILTQCVLAKPNLAQHEETARRVAFNMLYTTRKKWSIFALRLHMCRTAKKCEDLHSDYDLKPFFNVLMTPPSWFWNGTKTHHQQKLWNKTTTDFCQLIFICKIRCLL